IFGGSLYTGSSWLLPVTASANDTITTITGATSFGDLAIGQMCNVNTTIAYNGTPYCAASGTALINLTVNAGGVFASSEGLSINDGTGSVTLATSVPGMYNVTYSIDATGECPSFLTSTNIDITAAPTAEGSY